MTPEHVLLKETWTVAEALGRIQRCELDRVASKIPPILPRIAHIEVLR